MDAIVILGAATIMALAFFFSVCWIIGRTMEKRRIRIAIQGRRSLLRARETLLFGFGYKLFWVLVVFSLCIVLGCVAWAYLYSAMNDADELARSIAESVYYTWGTTDFGDGRVVPISLITAFGTGATAGIIIGSIFGRRSASRAYLITRTLFSHRVTAEKF